MSSSGNKRIIKLEKNTAKKFKLTSTPENRKINRGLSLKQQRKMEKTGKKQQKSSIANICIYLCLYKKNAFHYKFKIKIRIFLIIIALVTFCRKFITAIFINKHKNRVNVKCKTGAII